MRGKETALAHAARYMRIIPAGAGKRRPQPRPPRRGRDHPRGCGEKYVDFMKRLRKRGSSPRVRGKGGRSAPSDFFRGIIPAGAGKRLRASLGLRMSRDHPRGCGEKRDTRATGHGNVGSSPRVRGKARPHAPPPTVYRIIPAGAGKSRGCGRGGHGGGDHPRGCGEKTRPRGVSARPLGSSPRVRGKAFSKYTFFEVCRIIPAGAGKRPQAAKRKPRSGDHPRGCGEKAVIASARKA